MFPNTRSWSPSVSARPEEAVSYRCQDPHWPLSLPQALHRGGLCPENKGLGGGLLWRNGKQTFLSQWQVELGHFKLCYTWTHWAWKQSRSSAFQWSVWCVPGRVWSVFLELTAVTRRENKDTQIFKVKDLQFLSCELKLLCRYQKYKSGYQ